MTQLQWPCPCLPPDSSLLWISIPFSMKLSCSYKLCACPCLLFPLHSVPVVLMSCFLVGESPVHPSGGEVEIDDVSGGECNAAGWGRCLRLCAREALWCCVWGWWEQLRSWLAMCTQGRKGEGLVWFKATPFMKPSPNSPQSIHQLTLLCSCSFLKFSFLTIYSHYN